MEASGRTPTAEEDFGATYFMVKLSKSPGTGLGVPQTVPERGVPGLGMSLRGPCWGCPWAGGIPWVRCGAHLSRPGCLIRRKGRSAQRSAGPSAGPGTRSSATRSRGAHAVSVAGCTEPSARPAPSPRLPLPSRSLHFFRARAPGGASLAAPRRGAPGPPGSGAPVPGGARARPPRPHGGPGAPQSPRGPAPLPAPPLAPGPARTKPPEQAHFRRMP